VNDPIPDKRHSSCGHRDPIIARPRNNAASSAGAQPKTERWNPGTEGSTDCSRASDEGITTAEIRRALRPFASTTRTRARVTSPAAAVRVRLCIPSAAVHLLLERKSLSVEPASLLRETSSRTISSAGMAVPPLNGAAVSVLKCALILCHLREVGCRSRTAILSARGAVHTSAFATERGADLLPAHSLQGWRPAGSRLRNLRLRGGSADMGVTGEMHEVFLPSLPLCLAAAPSSVPGGSSECSHGGFLTTRQNANRRRKGQTLIRRPSIQGCSLVSTMAMTRIRSKKVKAARTSTGKPCAGRWKKSSETGIRGTARLSGRCLTSPRVRARWR
jgi:hypothetical protein